MMHTDVARAKRWIELRWGKAGPSWTNWESSEFFDDFQPYTYEALMESLAIYYRAGNRYAPTSSELIKLVAETQRRRVEAGLDTFDRECSGRHVWAAPLPYDDDRRMVCAVCYETGPVAGCEHLYWDGRCVYCPDTVEAA